MQVLKWPEEIVLFFQTSQVATKVLTVLFPYPELVESENLKIRVKITAFPDIDWTFQSSMEKFRSLETLPLKNFVNTNGLGVLQQPWIKIAEEKSVLILSGRTESVRVQLMTNGMTCIRKLEITIPGLEMKEFYSMSVNRSNELLIYVPLHNVSNSTGLVL